MSALSRLYSLVLLFALTSCSLPSPLFQVEAPTPSTTPAPPTATPIVLSETVRVQQGGFSVSLPSGWQSREISGTVTLAPDVAALTQSSPGETLVVTIDSTPLDLIAARYGNQAANDAEAFFEISSGSAQEAGYTLSATRPITIDNQVGLGAELSAAGGTGELVVVLTDGQAIRVLGQANAESWPSQRVLFEQVLSTMQFFAATPLATPTLIGGASQPRRETAGPQDFVLRLGGSDGAPESRFVATRGLAIAENGDVYVAESSRGVWVFDQEGTLLRTFGMEELLDAYDIAFGPDDMIYVADFGRNAIARFTMQGELIDRIGSAGEGEDQFSFSAPQRIAVGDDMMYALDSRISNDGSRPLSTLMRFDLASGAFRDRIALPPGSAPSDLALDSQGNIYLAETFSATIVKLDPQGRELARLGENVIEGGVIAGAIDVDASSNIYAATWSAGVLKLTAGGALVGQVGSSAASGAIPNPGEFSLPNGIAAAPNGTVWVSDNNGEYSALTALRIQTDEAAAATAAAVEETSVAATAAAASPVPEARRLRQWASTAAASSFYAPDYDAAGATGPPDVEGCQDSTDAWASADPNGYETLALRYDTPVYALAVNVHQNHQPGYIVKVELIDERGGIVVAYEGEPQPGGECPAIFTLEVERTVSKIVGVRLTLDQRSGANWNEIDAVELVGVER